MDSRPIGIFDSGVGGLSVLKELQVILPQENFVYLADQRYLPYGDKSKKELIQIVYRITDYFIKRHKVKMIVVACNTATCNTISELRSKYAFPIIGTVPAVAFAAQNTKTRVIAVISTVSTSKSIILKNLINENCNNIKVLNIGCKGLVSLVELADFSNAVSFKIIQKYLHKVKVSNADQLVLGCTHYAFLRKAIQKFVGSDIRLISSGKVVVKETRSQLKINSLKNTQKKKGNTIYFSTGNSVNFSKVASKLLKIKINAHQVRI